MNQYDPEKHHRQSTRLKGFDYTESGAYFVTLVTHQRECLFGNVTESGEMVLNELGQIVHEEWNRSAEIRREIKLDEFAVMPNHIHGIIWIKDNVGAHGRAPDNTTQDNRPDDARIDVIERADVRPPQRHDPQRRPKSIGSFVAGFKSAAATRINQHHGTPGILIWQRNYHDRIIRNDKELIAIRQYISDNPAKWAEDAENQIENHRRGAWRAPNPISINRVNGRSHQ